MKHRHRQLAAAAVLGVVVAASIAAQSGSASFEETPSPLTSPMSLDDEFKDFVRASLEKNATSGSAEEWQGSGLTLSDILANAQARSDRSDALDSICRALSQITDSSLAIFQEELDTIQNGALLTCSTRLRGRIQNYMSQRSKDLHAHGHPRVASGSLDSYEVGVDPTTVSYVEMDRALNPGEVALVFDGGPHPVWTQRILSTLKGYGVRANFFNRGQTSKRWSELAQSEISQGHVVGSHSYPNLAKLDVKSAQNQIDQSRRLVSESTGAAAPLIRLPYKAPIEATKSFLKQHHLAALAPNIDSEDWKRPDPSDLLQHALSELDAHSGGALLLHDAREQTALALPLLLDELKRRGWKTVVFVPR